jgi:segregation and condensation protein B
MFKNTRKLQLSRPALEALSIIAYRQPVSKAEVESIRGVECGSVVNTLMERELITVKGRGKTVGRPLLFGTTQIFLESFGLENTADLPKLKELSELMGDNPDPVLFENDHATE